MEISTKRRILASMLVLALLALPAPAQESTGAVSGVVTDASGAAIPGAKIVVTGPRLPKGLETTTDGAGNYAFVSLPVGVYSISVSATGFQTTRQAELEVRLGSQVNFSPKLNVGQMAEVVEVTAAANQIDTASSRTVTSLQSSQMLNLPTGRTFNSILAIAPGVRSEVKGGNAGVGGFSVDGASGSENTFFLDGVEVSDVRRGSLRQQNAIPIEFTQEVNIRSGGFEAEYGGATGGVVNVSTKGGSNDFHGQVYFQTTNDGLNARDRGYYQRSAANADLAEFFRPREDSYSIWYPGGILSGRLLRDRLFFTSGYSPELEHTTRAVPFASGTRTYDQRWLRHYMVNRLDWNATSKLQVNSTWIWSPFKRTGTLPSRDQRLAPLNGLERQGGFVPAQTVSVGATYALTPKIVVTGRYGYRYLNDKDGNYGLPSIPFITYNTSSVGIAGVPSTVQFPNGYTNTATTLAIVKDITTRHNVYLDGTWIKNIGGQQHTFKFGYALNRLGNEVLSDFTNGQFTVNWNDSYSRGSVRDQRGTYGYYTWQDGVRLNNGVNSRNQGFYIQDQWRAHARLTLNLGVRFENEFLPPYTPEFNGIKISNPVSFGWGDKIAPRIGAAWDIFGDGQWKLAGNFGLFYDTMKYELARGSFGGDYWWSHVYRLNDPNVFNLSRTNPGALGPNIVSFNNRTIPINAAGELEGIDPDIKPYTSREFSLMLEKQFNRRGVASIRYVRKDLLKAIEDIGVLDAEDNEVYLIGNPGFGQTRNTNSVYGQKTPDGQEFLVPEAKRQYDAVEFRFQGKVGGLNLIPSYTWSRLYGNYSGLANSDEAGRSDPGVSRAYDLPYYYFDASGSQRNVLGRLGTDRPHTFKLFAYYDLKSRLGNTFFGLNQLAYQGTLDSTSVIYLSAPTFPFGRGDLGRTPAYTQTDLQIAHTFKMTERMSVRLEANARNLFNQGTVISRATQLNRNGAITIDPSVFFRGYNPYNYVLRGAGSVRFNPIYGLPGAAVAAGGARAIAGVNGTGSSAFAATNPNFGAYQDIRTFRFGMRLMF
ncbi:MAG: TonB-dependent receptor [Bryobacteraceae bacterium]|nr:TonB-dependent receptor [Bryobacteraceae bacterium]